MRIPVQLVDGRRRTAPSGAVERGDQRPRPGRSRTLTAHIVHLAVNMVGDVRRRAVHGKYGRRGQVDRAEPGVRRGGALNRPVRAGGPAPCERTVHDRLFAFYDWCARHEDGACPDRRARTAPTVTGRLALS
jgi:hypothetical protein